MPLVVVVAHLRGADACCGGGTSERCRNLIIRHVLAAARLTQECRKDNPCYEWVQCSETYGELSFGKCDTPPAELYVL